MDTPEEILVTEPNNSLPDISLEALPEHLRDAAARAGDVLRRVQAPAAEDEEAVVREGAEEGPLEHGEPG